MRVVKLVTEAASKYYTQEKSDGGIRAQESSRRLIQKAESKQDLQIKYVQEVKYDTLYYLLLNKCIWFGFVIMNHSPCVL